jgi:hypothetical protein
MKIIMASRGSCKTYQCIQELRSNPNAIMLVPLEVQKTQILSQYRYKNLEKRIFSLNNATRHKFAGVSKNPQIIIDNLEAVLQGILHAPCILATFSIEDRRPDSVYCSMEG